jgi:predicted short-subunit dehydrogenase-like oxidoreductase (DUF2520 family)
MTALIKSVSIIGSGNIAFHLASALLDKGIIINEIIGRNKDKVTAYANQFNAKAVFDFTKVSTNVDLIIISVNDNAIKEVADQLKLKDKLVVHTSGSVEMEILKNASNQVGVFYPLQTFSVDTKSYFSVIPICIEGSSESVRNKLSDLALLLSTNVYFINSEKRKCIHLAAVVSNNFINYLLSSTFNFLEEKDIDKEILLPLIDETIERIKTNNPDEIQTGPARRNDIETISVHSEMLKDFPQLQEIYKLMSHQILKKYHGEKL